LKAALKHKDRHIYKETDDLNWLSEQYGFCVECLWQRYTQNTYRHTHTQNTENEMVPCKFYRCQVVPSHLGLTQTKPAYTKTCYYALSLHYVKNPWLRIMVSA